MAGAAGRAVSGPHRSSANRRKIAGPRRRGPGKGDLDQSGRSERGKGGPVCATLALCPWPGVPGGGAEAAWEGGLESERAGRRGRCWSAGRLALHGCAPAGAPLAGAPSPVAPSAGAPSASAEPAQPLALAPHPHARRSAPAPHGWRGAATRTPARRALPPDRGTVVPLGRRYQVHRPKKIETQKILKHI
jgi:hypothetical protein